MPARYGGFETAVEEVGSRLADRGHEVVVFCRGDAYPSGEYKGMSLVHLPALRSRIGETLSHTALSVLHRRARRSDVAFVFNCANAILLPMLRRQGVPVAVHVDGLEWQRSKWSATGQKFYRASERLAVRWGDVLIADSRGIQDYYRDQYHTETRYIAYGAPSVAEDAFSRVAELNLVVGKYHLVVARFEPENNVHTIVEAYVRSNSKLPLVVVGSAPYSMSYVQRIERAAAGDKRVKLLGSVWDQGLLDGLYAGAASYVHGHSVGGTNPSLLRAAGAGAPTLAFDVIFNREVLGDAGSFWADREDLSQLFSRVEENAHAFRKRGYSARERVLKCYSWDVVAENYEQLAIDLSKAATRKSVS